MVDNHFLKENTYTYIAYYIYRSKSINININVILLFLTVVGMRFDYVVRTVQ